MPWIDVRIGRLRVFRYYPYVRIIKRKGSNDIYIHLGIRSRSERDYEAVRDLFAQRGWIWHYWEFREKDFFVATFKKDVKSIEDVESCLDDLKEIGALELYPNWEEKVLAVMLSDV